MQDNAPSPQSAEDGRKCLTCNNRLSKDNPFTYCDECWDKKYPSDTPQPMLVEEIVEQMQQATVQHALNLSDDTNPTEWEAEGLRIRTEAITALNELRRADMEYVRSLMHPTMLNMDKVIDERLRSEDK